MARLPEHPNVDHLKKQAKDLLSCAVGDDAFVRAAIARNPAIVHRTFDAWKCPCCDWVGYAMPPIVAVTHSGLLRLERFRDGLHRTARVLLDAGTDPNQSTRTAADEPLSALYGAAGKNHDAGAYAPAAGRRRQPERQRVAVPLKRDAGPDNRANAA